MANVQDLEKAVASLEEREYTEFRQWFFANDWDLWDRQITQDSQSGRLEFLVKEAADAKKAGQLKDL